MKTNNIAEYLDYVSQLNYVQVDGDKFIADNGARLILQYKLTQHFGLSGIQLVLSLFALPSGGMLGSWGSTSDGDNKAISIWWQQMESKIREAEYEAEEKATKELRAKLG